MATARNPPQTDRHGGFHPMASSRSIPLINPISSLAVVIVVFLALGYLGHLTR
jgi:hypothetical protein